jgi:hypothetical protein
VHREHEQAKFDHRILEVLEHSLHELREIRRELKPRTRNLTAAIAVRFTGTGEPTMNNILTLNVGQTSTASIAPLLTDGVTPSGGTLSAVSYTFSDQSATVVLNPDGLTATVTGVAASAGPISVGQLLVLSRIPIRRSRPGPRRLLSRPTRPCRPASSRSRLPSSSRLRLPSPVSSLIYQHSLRSLGGCSVSTSPKLDIPLGLVYTFPRQAVGVTVRRPPDGGGHRNQNPVVLLREGGFRYGSQASSPECEA